MHTLSIEYNLLCVNTEDLIYTHVLDFLQKNMWDETHQNPFGLGFIDVIEVCICIVLILGDITILIVLLIIWYTVVDIKFYFSQCIAILGGFLLYVDLSINQNYRY